MARIQRERKHVRRQTNLWWWSYEYTYTGLTTGSDKYEYNDRHMDQYIVYYTKNERTGEMWV